MRAFLSNNQNTASDQDPRILRAQLELIVNSLFFTTFVNPLGLAMMFGPVLLLPQYFGTVPLSHIWIACGLHTVSCVAAGLIYRKRGEHFDLVRMERRLAWLQLQLGLTWGATIWLLWAQGNSTNNVFVTLAMTSMLWAATATRATHMRLYLIGFISMSGCYWLRLATGGTAVAHLLAGLLAIWLIYIFFMGAAIRGSLFEMLKNRFANEDMTSELERARDEAQLKRRDAEYANRSKTAFLANMSHELRTPLNAILGFSDMIANEGLEETVPQRYREYAQDINDSGVHLLSLINDLLDVAKIEAGRMEINPQTLDLTETIAIAERLIAPKLAARRQTLVTTLHPDLAPLVADERAVKQIVLNLLSNANKFTPDGGHIALSCGPGPEGGTMIVVEDNGIGIPSAKLDTIFQPFAQADNRYDRASGGSGLGLALVRGLTELHAGRALIESTEHVGTRVSIYFPLSNIAADGQSLRA